jgi:hypothetical protein
LDPRRNGREIRKYLEKNKKENTTYQNLCNGTKVY